MEEAVEYHSEPLNRGANMERDAAIAASKESGGYAVSGEVIDTTVPRIAGFKWIAVCASLYISVLIYGLDTTIAADIQAPVTKSFGAVDQLAWLGAGFSLGSVAAIAPFGALFTCLNMKYLYIAGMVLFQAGSALCGAAPNMNALIVGRVIAGIGGTGVYLGCLNYFSTSLVAPERRGVYISGIAFVWGIGSVLGPVVGGGFSISKATWRWAFYINLLIGVIAAPVYLFALPSVRYQGKETSARDVLKRFDYIGFILSAAAWVMFTVVFTFAGNVWPWNSGKTIASLVVLGILIMSYVVQQYFCIFTSSSTRSFPGHLLRSRTQILLAVATACTITSLYVPVYYIPIFFQFVESDTPLKAAVRLLPFVLVCVAVNLASGFFLSKLKYYQPLYIMSGVFITLGGSLYYVYLDPSSSAGAIYGISVLTAFGTGITLQIGYTVASLKAALNDVGNAISIQNLTQIGGTVCALVIAGQVFQNSAVRNLTRALSGYGFSSSTIRDAVAGSQSQLFEQLQGEVKEAALLAITKAIQEVFLLVISAGSVLIIVGMFMKTERLLT
ncbi:major facilitator superfamily domain-containing protein [Xylogone sp. PMI_703]|nr:major facilitator superfamily domain-containing protein [Xylogone sp. PMI_703]